MPRKIADCRAFPSEVNCTLTLSGEEAEVVKAATEHAVSIHGHTDSAELRDQIQKSLKDEIATGGVSASKSFDQPDEVRKFKATGQLMVLNFGEGQTIGKAQFEPGWEWSRDVKPLAGTDSCEAPHAGYCLKGQMEIRMDDGKKFTIRAGDAFEIAPGHDAKVIGTETCEMIDVAGYGNYAVPKAEQKAA